MMQRCDAPSGVCVQCEATMDCPMMRVCDLADHACVDCLVDGDCAKNQVCDAARRCVAPACVPDAQAAPAGPDAAPMMPAAGKAIATP